MSGLLYRFGLRALLLGLLVLLLAGLAAFLLLRPQGPKAPPQPPPAGAVVQGDQAIAAIAGARLTLRLQGRLPRGTSLFATLTSAGRQLWTKRLEPAQPLGSALPAGDYALALVVSRCAGDCAVVHPGAVGLAPLALSGGHDATVLVTPVCRRAGGALDCSQSRLRLTP